MTKTFFAAAAACILALAPVASADTFNIVGSPDQSTEGLCNFAGTLEWTPAADGLSGILKVSLTNTTAPALGGRITGFLFNTTSTDGSASFTLLPGSTHPFSFAKGNGQPYGMHFKAGAALGGNWQGGGNPNPGIAVGATGVFSFLVVADDAGSLSAADFAAGPYQHNFVVRFRGLANGGSDKVPGIPAPPPPPSACECDLNGDGVVDELDLEIILIAFEYCIENPDCSGPIVEAGDFVENGIVDIEDLKKFLLCWDECEQ